VKTVAAIVSLSSSSGLERNIRPKRTPISQETLPVYDKSDIVSVYLSQLLFP
jgi:hypothetical protein